MVEQLDSLVKFLIPREEMDSLTYRNWVDIELFQPWLSDFEGNPEYKMFGFNTHWNQETGIHGNFNGEYIYQCKLFKYDREKWDGTIERYILFADHYSEADVKKVQLISNRFEEFLKQKSIQYQRENRTIIVKK